MGKRMKEFEPNNPEQIELRVEKQHKKAVDFVGSFIKYPGHTVWEINLKSQEITPAEFSEEVVDFTTGAIKRKIIAKPAHWYCSALNKKAAFNKFNKMAKAFVEKQKDKSNLQ